MNILVTGAAGYIGSVVTEELVSEGHRVIAMDNLDQGHREAVMPDAIFVQLDLKDVRGLERLFERNPIEVVIHLAANSTVDCSASDPGKYFQSNVVYGLQLLDVMRKYGVCKLIFSSTAAVYGEPKKVPIEENAPTTPVNAYGESKLVFERALHWYARAYGLQFICFRYFNAAGASKLFGEDHRPETHLIPNILKVALGQAEHVFIFGTDYPTSDGTCVRDYIHVLDIAKAHILALECLEHGIRDATFNLGNNRGYSVLEVVEVARRVTGVFIPVIACPRRVGDPPSGAGG